MSAIGSGSWVISIGMSCQSAMQIRRQAGLLSRLLGEPLKLSTFPFDWLILPPEGFCSLLGGEEQARFPAGPADLEHQPQMGPNALFWPRHGFYFWHDFYEKGQPLDLAGQFETVRAKYAYQWEKLLRPPARRVFVLSNTQNNLDALAARSGLSFTLDGARIGAVQAALEARFPSGGSNELIVAAYADRLADDPAGWPQACPTKCYVLEPDESGFGGCDRQWAALLADYFGAEPGLKP